MIILGIQMPGSQARPPRWNLILVALVNMVRNCYDATLTVDKVKHPLLSSSIRQYRGRVRYYVAASQNRCH